MQDFNFRPQLASQFIVALSTERIRRIVLTIVSLKHKYTIRTVCEMSEITIFEKGYHICPCYYKYKPHLRFFSNLVPPSVNGRKHSFTLTFKQNFILKHRWPC